MKKKLGMPEWAEHIKHVNRFCLTEEQQGFLGTALDFVGRTPHNFPATKPLFRARKHAVKQERSFPLCRMGAPPIEMHQGGRCSPVGIPCLYLASDPETAIAETRPWKSALVSVATFRLTRSIKLADLRDIGHRAVFLPQKDGNNPEDERATIGRVAYLVFLNNSFSRPSHEDSAIDYAPTQFVASILKANGFDGIIYSSLLRSMGFNVALFTTALAAPRSVDVYEVKDVDYWSRKKEPKDASDVTLKLARSAASSEN